MQTTDREVTTKGGGKGSLTHPPQRPQGRGPKESQMTGKMEGGTTLTSHQQYGRGTKANNRQRSNSQIRKKRYLSKEIQMTRKMED